MGDRIVGDAAGRICGAVGSMTERVDDGGLVLFDLMASVRKLGRGAMVRRSFCEALTLGSLASSGACARGERLRSIDTLFCRADRGKFDKPEGKGRSMPI